ncbi:MAG: hypothetical protein IJ064_04055 [Bacteroidaceae bacterium]|nr:hypothetical protein [Bacteroidaceae bacterium]
MEDDLRQREKPRLLRVSMPDGEVICYNRVKHTYLDVLKKIDSSLYPQINLKVGIYPLLSKETYPKYQKKTEDLGNGWYVILSGGTSEKYLQLRSIAKQLGLNMEVEIGDDFITQKLGIKNSGRKKDNKLLVQFPDRTFVAGENPIDSLLESIWKNRGGKYCQKRNGFFRKAHYNILQIV